MARQELQSWRSERGSRLWLSLLVSAMEDVRDSHGSPQDADLAELRLQLSLPASLQSYPTSAFSFKN